VARRGLDLVRFEDFDEPGADPLSAAALS